jgi:hypothetical protein
MATTSSWTPTRARAVAQLAGAGGVVVGVVVDHRARASGTLRAGAFAR